MRTYFSESHKKYSEACQKEVAEMSKHPLSEEEFRAQIRRNREESMRRANLPTTRTMYASGLICGIVCEECGEKPCPRQNWLAKNACPRIIAYNEKLGKCCATCMHLVAEEYCSEKAGNKKVDASTDFSQFLIEEDIFQHTCEKWTNTYEE